VVVISLILAWHRSEIAPVTNGRCAIRPVTKLNWPDSDC
jgi:hypothetical protein